MSFIENLTVTPWGILAGERDTRLWLDPFNGLYISKDFGKSWTNFALPRRGITSVFYDNNVIYSTTYYSVENSNGLFISLDAGKTWKQTGPKVSASKVVAKDGNILLGTFSHGLWHSQDNGNSWEQIIGDGFTGPQIYSLFIENNMVLVALQNKTQMSLNNGASWQDVETLKNFPVKNFAKQNDYIWAGTGNTEGLWYSINNGETWTKNFAWGNRPVDALGVYKNTLFVGSNGKLYKSYDFGSTWLDVNLEKPVSKIVSIIGIYGFENYILTAITSNGIFSTKYIPEIKVEPFLQIPWSFSSGNELLTKIYSFFDHEFPFLGYANHTEPEESRNSTVNFFGIKEKIPNLYYSNHDGIDFALPYGTQIKAAASGIAYYNYDKYGLGNYITIDHQNGYKTIYAHLQTEGLIMGSPTETKNVSQGQVIGKVGMSGNTTGPHLHFAVQKTNIQRPDNRVDPFGWLPDSLQDPWYMYSWQDINGNHLGPKSHNIWIENINESSDVLTVTNLTEVTNNNSYINVTPYAIPKKETFPEKLLYVENTSRLVEIINILGEKITNLDTAITLTFNLVNSDLTGINTEWLRVYFFDEIYSKWIPIDSVFDISTKILRAETNHLSWFAVFGPDKNNWEKTLKVNNLIFSIE